MKILVRNIERNENGNAVCTYIWKKVRTTNPFNGRRYVAEDGDEYSVGEILKITGDFRLSRKGKYMICANCGKVVKENEALKHFQESERGTNCANCGWFKVTDEKIDPKRIIRQDGTVVTKSVGIAKCTKGLSYWRSDDYEPIGEVDKVAHCKYFRCRRAGLNEIQKDFLSENPNPISKILTEKAVINSKSWKYMNQEVTGRQYSNTTGNVLARFDTNGILRGFTLLYRDNTTDFYYSDKYDKFYTNSGAEFDWRVNWNQISENSKTRYQKQIRALYGIKN